MTSSADRPEMSPRKWFEVGARLIGVWTLLGMISELRTILVIRMELFNPSTPLLTYIIHAACDAAAGFYLLFAAGHLSGIVFGQEGRGFEVSTTSPMPPPPPPAR